MAKYDRNIASRLMADLQRDYGMTHAQAAAVVGNLAHESSGFRQLQEVKPIVPGSKGGFGFAQWTGPRRRSFERWSKSNGLDIRSYEANYGFLKHEIATDPYEGNKFRQFLRQSVGAPISKATELFSNLFLRPDPGIPHMNSRKRMAAKVANLDIDEFDTAQRLDVADANLPIPADRPDTQLASTFDPGGILNPDQAGSLSLITQAQAMPVPDARPTQEIAPPPNPDRFAGITSATPQTAYVDQSPLNPAPFGLVERGGPLPPAITNQDIAQAFPFDDGRSQPHLPVSAQVASVGRDTLPPAMSRVLSDAPHVPVAAPVMPVERSALPPAQPTVQTTAKTDRLMADPAPSRFGDAPQPDPARFGGSDGPDPIYGYGMAPAPRLQDQLAALPQIGDGGPHIPVPVPVGNVNRSTLPPAVREQDMALSSPVAMPSEGPRLPVYLDTQTTSKTDRLRPEPDVARFGPPVTAGMPLPATSPPVASPAPLPPPTPVQTVSFKPNPPVQPANPADYAVMASLPGYADDITTVSANPLESIAGQTFERAPVLPAPPPVVPTQRAMTATPATAYAPAPTFAPPPPPPPSGYDFWSGQSNFGVATDGTELTRGPDGMYRYNPKFDHSQRVRADGVGVGPVIPGRIGGPLDGENAIETPKKSNPFGNLLGPSETRMGAAVKGGLGSIAGGMAGSAFGGPIGGMIGAALGRAVAGRQAPQPVMPIHATAVAARNQPFVSGFQSGLPFPSAPRAPSGGGVHASSGRTHAEMAAISPAAADAVRDGKAGLF